MAFSLSAWRGVNVHGTAENGIKSEKEKKSLYRTRELHVMLIPAVVFTTVFAYLPIFGLVMAFQDFKPLMGFRESPFVGLKQFQYIFTMPSFRTAFVNTMIISFLKSY